MVNFKTVCLAKSKLLQGLVFDKDLKHLMQKEKAIETHERVTNYMVARGFYHPYNMNAQTQLDLQEFTDRVKYSCLKQDVGVIV